MRKKFNQPLGGNEMPRFGGIASMMRLPAQSTPDGLDAAFIGIPLDIGTSLRPGTRFGPRGIRAESVLIRPYNMATRAAPFDSLNVADLGDVAINTFNLQASIGIIEAAYHAYLQYPMVPLTLGVDDTITLPILRAMRRKHGPVGLIHVDAHTDTNDTMFGEKIAHGTTFRRAIEEDLIDGHRTVQIGVRAQGYTAEDFDWGRKQNKSIDGRRGFGVFQSYTWNDDSLKFIDADNNAFSSSWQNITKTCLNDIYKKSDSFFGSAEGMPSINQKWENSQLFVGAFKNNLPGQYRYQKILFEQFFENGNRLILAGDDISWVAGWAEGAVTTALNAVSKLEFLFNGSKLNPKSPHGQFEALKPIELPS